LFDDWRYRVHSGDMQACKRIFGFVVVLTLLVGSTGCPKPIPPTSKWIECGGKAIRAHGLPLIPKVNDCLTSGDGWQVCLISLISPAVGITEDVLACVLRQQNNQFAAQAAANPSDDAAAIAAARAAQFIKDRRYTFGPPPTSGVGSGD
jgi:hypothetical protein